MRLAWHLGNRHTEVQIAGGRLRIRRDHVLEDMLRGLGAQLTPLEAPFDPEPSGPGQGHEHAHAKRRASPPPAAWGEVAAQSRERA